MRKPNELPLTGKAAWLLGGFVIAAGTWTVAASFVLLVGTGLLPTFRYPLAQWWQYLPYAGQSPRLHWWLITSGIAAGLLVAVPLSRLVWEMFLAERVGAERPLHGETRFATEGELRRSGFYTERPGDYGE